MSEGLVYAYQNPRSEGQRAFIENRLAQLAAQRQAKSLEVSRASEDTDETSSKPPVPDNCRQRHGLDSSLPADNSMEMLLAPFTSSIFHTSSSMTSDALQNTIAEQQNFLKNPFELRHGRRYLRDVPYPLPCDLAETQRQNLRTLVGIQVFGGVACAPKLQHGIPKKVLELGCGSAYWSAMCHDHYKSLGHEVEFVGLDIAPLAPSLEKQGVNWRFVQHDLRRTPLPFDDGEFDCIMLKDLSLLMPVGHQTDSGIAECVRILRSGGTIEVWDSDHIIRSLPPNLPLPPPSRKSPEQKIAHKTGTFAIQPGYPFIPSQNKYLQAANTWISEALKKRLLHPTPCVRIGDILMQECELTLLNYRRVAIPLGETRWETENSKHNRSSSNSAHDSIMSSKAKGKAEQFVQVLTPDQAALRQAALMTVVQMIESMEPMLAEVSGKNSEEWSLWWTSMMADLLDPSKPGLNGECLEMGAWWATKSTADDD